MDGIVIAWTILGYAWWFMKCPKDTQDFHDKNNFVTSIEYESPI